jgi:hypothetical protein
MEIKFTKEQFSQLLEALYKNDNNDLANYIIYTFYPNYQAGDNINMKIEQNNFNTELSSNIMKSIQPEINDNIKLGSLNTKSLFEKR